MTAKLIVNDRVVFGVDKLRLELPDGRSWEVSVEDLVRDLELCERLRAAERRGHALLPWTPEREVSDGEAEGYLRPYDTYDPWDDGSYEDE